ncbi:hypothetical protein [Bacteroides sp.]|uniref:hypothetical protein n=1 Tax=Bacteroides sp. TaxID=29523 RepID=UPI0025C185CF|nr:hypothetical protein [Bacteroides sp.]
MNKDYALPQKIYFQLLKREKGINKSKPGRPNIGSEENIKPQKIYCRNIKVNKEGYDVGGAFWGKGKNIYMRFTLDKTFVEFLELDKPPTKKLIDKGLNVCNEILHPIKDNGDAQRGRENVGRLEDVNGKMKIYSRKVQLTNGYDKGGAYWGQEGELYVDFTLDKSYIYFHREHYGSRFVDEKLNK